MEKKSIMLATIFGSIVGSYLPTLFGAGMFSLVSVLGGAVGGILGLWLSFKFLG